MRLHGKNDELRDEIVHLSRRFGIITPYTSFIVLEDRLPTPQANAGQSILPRVTTQADLPISNSSDAVPFKGPVATNDLPLRTKLREPEENAPTTGRVVVRSKASGNISSAPGLAMVRDVGAKMNILDSISTKICIGKEAVKTSKETQKLKLSNSIISHPKTGIDKIKRVGEKVFYLQNGVWMDSEYKQEMKTTDVKYGGDAYFELLNKKPELGKYFAIGKQLILCYQGGCYQVTLSKS